MQIWSGNMGVSAADGECTVSRGSPGVHALHHDLVLFALHHVVGEHGVEVRYGRRQDDPVSAELVIPDLPGADTLTSLYAICRGLSN